MKSKRVVKGSKAAKNSPSRKKKMSPKEALKRRVFDLEAERISVALAALPMGQNELKGLQELASHLTQKGDTRGLSMLKAAIAESYPDVKWNTGSGAPLATAEVDPDAVLHEKVMQELRRKGILQTRGAEFDREYKNALIRARA